MYIANLTRPDLVTAVHKLSRYVQNPSHSHYRALTRVVTFAYQTRDRCLRYTQTPEDLAHDPYRLYAASDSSYADCLDTGRSTVGRCVWMGKKCSGLIDWKSSLPKLAASSSTHAEIQAAVECTKDIIYNRVLLHDLGYHQKGSTRMLIDNNACISQINAVSGIVKSRHYIVMLREIQECLHLGVIHTQRVDSKDNIADMFTKPLPVLPFWRLSTEAIGDQHATAPYSEIRNRALLQELNGGSVKELKSEMRAKKEQRRAEQVERKNIQEAATVMALNLATTIIERAGLGSDIGAPAPPKCADIASESQNDMT